MEEEINKLISQYNTKIEDVESLLCGMKTTITALRNNGGDYSHLRKEQSGLHAKLFAYMQAKSDIDSLLDYVKTEDLTCSK